MELHAQPDVLTTHAQGETVTKAIVIPVEGDPYLQEINKSEDIHALVDGWFEVIDLRNPGASLWINEESLMRNHPVNGNLLWLVLGHHPNAARLGFLRGQAVLLGPMTGNEDDVSDVDEYFIDLLVTGTRFTALVKLKDAHEWKDMQMPFDTWRSAYTAVLDLKGRWDAVEFTKVVPL